MATSNSPPGDPLLDSLLGRFDPGPHADRGPCPDAGRLAGLSEGSLHPGERTVLDRILGPVERLIYRVAGVEPAVEMNWKMVMPP